MKAKRSKVVKNEHVRTAHFSEHLDSSDAHSYTHATQIPRGVYLWFSKHVSNYVSWNERTHIFWAEFEICKIHHWFQTWLQISFLFMVTCLVGNIIYYIQSCEPVFLTISGNVKWMNNNKLPGCMCKEILLEIHELFNNFQCINVTLP